MNISQAKNEVKNTIRAYLSKDESGSYLIPVERQRPILLMGPPGIGKTAIVEQAARECGINLVSYTITHHTRQSAIGLPFIAKKVYGGEEKTVTEYTMSEIIAAVYEQIERTGIKEGILFLDEINCVSETLAPTMLQFLQYKTFGNHSVPAGFVIVTAGNPPEYNKSVHDFDIVTLDRVKKIDIEEDYEAFKEYAGRAQLHGSIRAYLEIRKKNFYSVISDLDGKRFVTARGWEDLSQIMKAYERLDIAIGRELTVQYLQDEAIARDFADYYELYNKYKEVYRIGDIVEGAIPQSAEKLREAPFDEKLSFLRLLIDRLDQDFVSYVNKVDNGQEADAAEIERTGEHLTNSFSFLAKTFGEGQELVIFLSELSAGYYSLRFVCDCGNEAFFKYNKLLLLKERKEELRENLQKLAL